MEDFLMQSFMQNVDGTLEGLKRYKEDIFKYILGAAYLPKQQRKEAYSKLIQGLGRYVFNKGGRLAGIEYKEIKTGERALYFSSENIIAINQDLLNLYLTEDEQTNNIELMFQFLKTYKTFEHEFAHTRQDYIREKTQISDLSILQRHKALKLFAELHPEKQEKYEDFAFTLYYTNIDEVYANKIAYDEAVNFANELQEFAKKEYPLSIETLTKIEGLTNPQELEPFLQGLSPQEQNGYFAKIVSDICVNFANLQQENFNNELAINQIKKIKLLPEIKKDFEDYAQMFVDTNGQTSLSEEGFLELTRIKDLTSEKVIDLFIEFNENHPEIENHEQWLQSWREEKMYFEKRQDFGVQQTQTSRLAPQAEHGFNYQQ